MNELDDYIRVHKLSCKSRRGDNCTCGQEQAVAELAALRQNAEVMDAEMSNLRRHAYVLVDDTPYSGDEVARLLDRIKKLEGNSKSGKDKCPTCGLYGGFHKTDCNMRFRL
jgi:hypothetical protein